MIEDFLYYSKISWKYLNLIWSRINCKKMLLGGWATHIFVDDRLFKIKRRHYIGSKDIDIFVENYEKVSMLLNTLGFVKEGKRFFIIDNGVKIYIDISTPKSNPDLIMEKAFD